MAGLWAEFRQGYAARTPRRVQLLDVFLVFVLLTGVVQAAYCALVGTFPFNSFLAGFVCTVGVFVLTVSLRLHLVNDEFKHVSEQRAFAEYLACNLVLFLAVVNFMG